MSRELGPIELRVCRMVFALLGLMILAFLGLGTIDSVFNPSPHITKVQSQRHPTYAASRYSTQLSKSSPQTQGADSQKDSEGPALRDDSIGVVLSSTEIHARPRGVSALERAIRFDPGLLDRRVDGTSFIPAAAGANSPSAGTFQSGPQREIFTAAFASAEAATAYRSEEALAESPASNRQGQPNELSVGTASLSHDHVQRIQRRLRDLGYLSSVSTGLWDLRSQDALRDFKLVNGLANTDTLDFETSEKLNSHRAIRANHSFLGSWSTAQCSSTNTKDLRVSISSRRVRASSGSICELQDFRSERGAWRVRANCSQGTQHWTAKGKFALKGDKLVWTSERDVISYFRCKERSEMRTSAMSH
jgi:hypothetical protein